MNRPAAQRPEVTDAQISEWHASGHKHKVIAAAIARWAASQDRGTPLPANAHFAPGIPFPASAQAWKNARRLLADTGVIHASDGPYQVA